nr:MAG TPA: hypothetical protein [Caudoviricetes sp.]
MKKSKRIPRFYNLLFTGFLMSRSVSSTGVEKVSLGYFDRQ